MGMFFLCWTYIWAQYNALHCTALHCTVVSISFPLDYSINLFSFSHPPHSLHAPYCIALPSRSQRARNMNWRKYQLAGPVSIHPFPWGHSCSSLFDYSVSCVSCFLLNYQDNLATLLLYFSLPAVLPNQV